MAVIDVKLVSGYQVEEESLDRVSIPVIGDLCYAHGILGLPGAKHCHSVGRKCGVKAVFSVHEQRITHLRCDFLRSGGCLILAR